MSNLWKNRTSKKKAIKRVKVQIQLKAEMNKFSLQKMIESSQSEYLLFYTKIKFIMFATKTIR